MKAIYESDYGGVKVSVIEIDGEDARISLMNDTPPLGEQGDESWVKLTDLK